MRKVTGIAALIGVVMVLTSFLSRYLDILPQRSRTTVLVVGFTIMFLSSIWRVVTDMNAKEKE